MVEMNTPVGDDDVRVEKSPKKRKKKNERPPKEGLDANERCQE
jgi:hypothetical protein